MMEFVRLLFLAKTILLTPAPIDIFGEIELKPAKPLTAITAGASIEIDVSSMIKKHKGEDIIQFRRKVEETFPASMVEAKLISVSRQELILSYRGDCAYSENAVLLILRAEGGVPIDIAFQTLVVRSRKKLEAVTVSWKNYQH